MSLEVAYSFRFFILYCTPTAAPSAAWKGTVWYGLVRCHARCRVAQDNKAIELAMSCDNFARLEDTDSHAWDAQVFMWLGDRCRSRRARTRLHHNIKDIPNTRSGRTHSLTGLTYIYRKLYNRCLRASNYYLFASYTYLDPLH